jgi:hypothetical protein
LFTLLVLALLIGISLWCVVLASKCYFYFSDLQLFAEIVRSLSPANGAAVPPADMPPPPYEASVSVAPPPPYHTLK